jgi:hypothetical protein
VRGVAGQQHHAEMRLAAPAEVARSADEVPPVVRDEDAAEASGAAELVVVAEPALGRLDRGEHREAPRAQRLDNGQREILVGEDGRTRHPCAPSSSCRSASISAWCAW